MAGRRWLVFLVSGLALTMCGLALGEDAAATAAGITGIGATVAFLYSAAKLPHQDPRPYRLFGAGLAVLFAGGLARELVGGSADLGFPAALELSGYGCLIAATLAIVRRRARGLDPTNLLDSLIVTSAAVVGMLPTVALPVVRTPSASVSEKAMELAFLVVVVFFFGALARLVLAPGLRTPAYYFYGLASAFAVANEITIAIGFAREGTVAFAILPIVISSLAFTFMGAAALHPDSVRITARATTPVAHLTAGRVALMCASALVAPMLVLTGNALETNAFDTRLITLGWTVVTALVVVRIAGVARAWQRAQSTERVLSRAAARLASSTDREQMTDAVFDAVATLFEASEARTTYLRSEGDAMVVERTEGWRAPPRTAGQQLESIAPHVHLDAAEPTAPRICQFSTPPDQPGDDPAWWISADMISQGRLMGRLVVASAKPLDTSLPDALAALANDFGSALHTAALTEEMHRTKLERRFRSLIENSDDVLIVVNASGTASFASPATARLLGYTEQSLESVHIIGLATPAYREQLAGLLQRPSVKQPPLEMQLVAANGATHWFEVVVSDLRNDPQILGIVLTCREIDDRKAAEMRLSESEARFRALVQHSSDVLAVIDRDGFITYVSGSVRRVLQRESNAIVGRELTSLIHPADLPVLSGLLYRLSTDPTTPHSAELRLAHGELGWRTLDVTLTDLTGDPAVNGIVLNAHDVTERRNLENDLRHQALHDSVTGLPNRVLFRDRVQQGIDLDRDGSVAVLVLDVDDFKTINDAVGHAIGDEVLRGIATRLSKQLRAADTLCRLGGDEFAVLIRDAGDREQVFAVVNRIMDEMREPVAAKGSVFTLSASMGVVFSADCPDVVPEILMRNADMAMHKAKSSGKARYVVYDEKMHSGVLERLALKNDLARAVGERQLVLAFQPIVSLRTARITGFEALMRWRHPERGLVSPASFIPLAEETGLIIPMGVWLLDTAFEQLANWRTQHDVTMSVNLSPRQLESADIVNDIAQRLERYGLDPATVTVELTESEAVETGGIYHERLKEIRALGVRVAADDFGSGYASYAALGQLPYTGVKIDMTIVQALDGANADGARAQIRSLCDMASSMGLSIVAEGVEGGEQAAALVALGCSMAQGYFFSPPVPADDAGKLLDDQLASLRR
jgi:diguanylate cyclase (GGDEF)-like protein/PAS domain S-box-containing protein